MGWLISGIVAWEIIFWIAYVAILFAFGYFSNSSVGDKLVFISPGYKWWLLILIPLIGIFIWNTYWKNNIISSIATPGLERSFLKPISTFHSFIKFILLRNAIAFLVLGAMQPAFGGKKVKAKINNLELVFAVDISNSMNVRDVSSSDTRLDVAKRAINQFINLSKGGKVGMVVFAASAFPQLPLTADYGAGKMYAEELSTDLISNQGTNISGALDLAADMFSKEKTKKAIVLITDGENHEGGIDETLKRLKEENIELCVLGIGTASGGLVPKFADAPKAGYFKDDFGKSVLSKIDEDMLKDIAKKGKGKIVISDSPYPNINSLLAQVNNLETTKIEDTEFDIKENRYQIFVFLALLSIIGYVLWGNGNLFTRKEEL